MILESSKVVIEGKIEEKFKKPIRSKRNRIKNFRIVTDKENRYVIEKKQKFLCWKWWSRNYIYDMNGCYIVEDKDTAKRILNILTKE